MAKNVYEERRTQKLLGLDDQRERDEDRAAMAELDWLENLDYEQRADEFEALSWRDWRGFPIPGHESPRFLNDRRP